MSSNSEVAGLLFEIAELYSAIGDFIRSRAYLVAAQRVESLAEDIRRIFESGRLEEIPGVGKGIASVIDEYLKSGVSSRLKKLRELFPKGALELMTVEGIGPKTAMRLFKELKISSIEQLEKAVESGAIRKLKGFGPRTEESLRQVLKERGDREERFLLGQILPVIKAIEDRLTDLKEIHALDVAGSVRRMNETVGDVDILVSSGQAEAAVESFVTMPTVQRVVSRGTTRSTVILKNGLQVDLRVVPVESYGSALQYFTGSKRHNIKIRTLAAKLGFKLNEYGLFERKSQKRIAGETEESVYEALGLPYIEPELREDRGEIEAGLEDALPDIVKYRDVKGDLHVHSEWSDGSGSLEEIAEAAMKRGLEYVAVCDHSRALGIARGLDEHRLRNQVREIERLNRKYEGFRLLSGIEANIMADGSLDLPDSALSDLDFVVASIHSAFKADIAKMTRRLLSAIHKDYVSTIGHPTGRLIQRRSPYQVNLEKIFEAAAEQKVMMEINAFPDRLDLNDVHSRMAMERGVRLSIGTDAHTTSQLKYLELGVSVARRAWLRSEDLANTLGADELSSKARQ